MATEILIQSISLVAAADLSAKQYYCVKVDSNGKAALCGAAENSVGILQNDPTSGQMATVGMLGLSKAKYGASVTAGANLMTDASGKLITATGTNPVIALALESGSTDEIRSVALVTKTSTGTNTKSVLSFPVTLANITGTMDVVTNYIAGFAGSITKFSFIVTTPVTTASKAATLNLEIGTTNLTGGVLSLTSANCTPLGAVVDATAITANNTFTSTDSISVEASSVTAFTEGAGVLEIVLG